MEGRLIYSYGAMDSAKTANLLMEAHGHERSKIKVLLIKPRRDTKGEGTVTSRIGLSRKVDILIDPTDNVFDLIPEDVESLYVDEAQFLTPEQVDQLMLLTVYKNINVFAYGLRTDFRTDGFPGSKRLLEIAHEIKEYYRRCRCKEGKAIFNARFLNGEIVTEGEQVAIDGAGDWTYEPLCAKCYYDLVYKNKDDQKGPVKIRKKDYQ